LDEESSNLQILDILKAISQIAKERMVQVFEHPPFANDVPNTLGAHDCTPGQQRSPSSSTLSKYCYWSRIVRRTLIFPYIFQSKCETSVFALDDADLAKGTLSDDS